MAGGFSGKGVSGVPPGTFLARLDTSDGVSDILTLLPYKGNQIVINGSTVTVPDAGLTRDIADNLIDAAGADAGAAPGVGVLYYVYVSNASASFSPASIRLSVIPPSLVDGVKYLGSTGNALNWRFVGWVFPNATPQFESSLVSRLIVNYYNRLDLPLFTCPGYVDDNAFTTYTFAAGNYVPLHGSVGDHIHFISNGEDAVSYHAQASVDNSPGNQANWLLGVGEDSQTTPAVTGLNLFAPTVTINCETCEKDTLFAEGYHFLFMLIASINAGGNVYADGPRLGGTNDPPITYITACIAG